MSTNQEIGTTPLNDRHVFFAPLCLTYLMILFTGCAATHLATTAPVIGEFNHETSVSAGYLSRRDPLKTDLDSYNSPYSSLHYRYGLFKNIDIAGHYWMPSALGLDIKYQFYKHEYFTLSGILLLTGGRLMADQSRLLLLGGMMALYASAHPSEWVELCLSPKLSLRSETGSDQNWSELSTNRFLYGFGVSTKIGPKSGVLLDFSYFPGSELIVSEFEFSLSVILKAESPSQ